MLILTVLPTSTPPVSSAWLKVMPKSYAVDLGLGRERDAAVAPRILAGAFELDVEGRRGG